MTEYRIKSNDLVHAPGVLRAAIHSYKVGDLKNAFNLASGLGFDGFPKKFVEEFLSGKVEWQEVQGDVVFKSEAVRTPNI
jgi:hypothetical protein